MTDGRLTVCRRVLAWAPLVDAECALRPQDRWLLLAIIAQESAGDPCAMRVEPAFWDRYRPGILTDLNRAGMTHWGQFPHVVAASYGLMQVMFPVALERGMTLAYPTSLCDPATGIEAGNRQFRHCVIQAMKAGAATTTPIVDALSRYNGGGNPEYPSGVQVWRRDLMEAAT